ncbi:MAG: hypothetical protein P1U46_02050 [Patescibacteria group bacterium]|nr:hypothetical protein [Patescibacteria group bacterium]
MSSFLCSNISPVFGSNLVQDIKVSPVFGLYILPNNLLVTSSLGKSNKTTLKSSINLSVSSFCSLLLGIQSKIILEFVLFLDKKSVIIFQIVSISTNFHAFIISLILFHNSDSSFDIVLKAHPVSKILKPYFSLSIFH